MFLTSVIFNAIKWFKKCKIEFHFLLEYQSHISFPFIKFMGKVRNCLSFKKKKIKISGSPGQNVWIKFQLSIIAGLEVLKKYKSWPLKVSYVRNNKLEDYPLVHTHPKIILFLENYHPKIITNMFITFPNWGSLWFSETTVNKVYGFWTAKWNKECFCNLIAL